MNRTSAALGVVALLTLVAPAAAEWPNDRPIKLVVGFGVGGGTDIVSRIVAQPLSELLHQTIIVENKPGAGGAIAGDQVARADKDGYTATMLSVGHAVSAVMVKAVRYDAVKDFAAVAQVADSSLVVVARKDFPANDIKGLIELAKASPGKLNVASVGLGSSQHFAGVLLSQMAGIDVKQIAYRGTPGVITALLAGECDYGVELMHAVYGQVQAGQLKMLAVAGPSRWPATPNVPAVADTVPGYSVLGWYGWAYPAGTPQPIIDKTNAALKIILARPEVQEQLGHAGAIVHFSTPDDFGKLIAGEVDKWRAVRDKAGLEAN
jgi:tripartite-type tricarboxylate transporter receptor subunit TctC